MNGSAKVVENAAIEIEITMRATVSEWNQLREQLGEKWPSWKFGAAISTALSQTIGRTERIVDFAP